MQSLTRSRGAAANTHRLIVTPGPEGAKSAVAWVRRTVSDSGDVVRVVRALIADDRLLPHEPVMLVLHPRPEGWGLEVRLPGLAGGDLLASVDVSA